jgi:hypothetical protein
MCAAGLSHPRDHRLEIESGYFGFDELRLGGGQLAGAADGTSRPVPTRLVIAERAVLRQVKIGRANV